MANRIAPEKLAKLRAWYVAHPEPTAYSSLRQYHRAAADHAECDWRVSRRYYDREIANFIKESQVLARAELTKESLKAQREAAPDLAANDASAQIAREAFLARGASIEALALLSQISKLRPKVKELIGRIESEPVTSMSAEQALERVESISRLAERAVILSTRAVQLERLRVGDPQLVVGVKQVPDDLSEADLQRELEAVWRASLRLRAQQQLEDGDVGEPN